MSQYAAAKNPPWVRNTVSAAANLAQQSAAGTSLATSILAAQASHASNAGAPTGQIAAAALPTGTLATAAAVVAAAQTQQAQQTPAVSAPYGTGLATITLAQSALPQGAVLQQPGIAIPASLAGTTQVNSGVVVELARLPQPGVALPTSLATTQVATVSYPAPRLLAQTAQFQAAQAAHQQQTAVVQQAAAAAAAQPATAQQQQQQSQTLKQRVFTGTVTKLHENFGFVDEDVFFQISAVKGTLPKAGERVLVEAAYNPNMPFKWNATRVQLLPNQMCQTAQMATTVMTTPVPVGLSLQTGVNMNAQVATISNNQTPQFSVNQQNRWQVQQEMAVIEQIGQQRVNIQYDNRLESGPHPWMPDSDYPEIPENKAPRMCTVPRRHSSPPPSRRERERERELRRDDRRERYRERYSPPPPPRKRSRSPRRPSRSPSRRRPRIVPRYTVQIPKISLDVKEANVMELRKRYSSLYIPSDFCSASFLWQEAFPPYNPFSLDHPCNFHIMNKDSEQHMLENEVVQEPSDTDHLYSAKVMLLAAPSLKEIFKKSCALAEDMEESKENYVHPTRLISFLVGLKGKNETVAIGGPWSPSLDGPNPDKDPSVLIRTAIRTCKALTGIDLSKCSQWYRFGEIYYRRGESSHKGRVLPTRVETVVLFLPDVWSCLPTRVEWDELLTGCKKQLQKKLPEEAENDIQEDEEVEESEKREPTHFSELDPRSIKVSDLKKELEARNLSSKGLKSQLISRLTKALKYESIKEQSGDKDSSANEDSKMDVEEANEEDEDEKKKENEEKPQKEQKDGKVTFERKVQLPEKPAILVYPSKTAKGGKFDCAIMSLSLLLDYRQEDNKEHSFEVSLFAELFNEMMMRDFGFRIYRALVEAPDPKDDDKDKEKKKKDDQKYKKEDKDEYRRKEEVDEDSDKEEDESFEDDGNGDDRKDRERKKRRKKRVQMYTADPYLLLACIYFDQTHCGHLVDKDLEELFYTLGLQLSRAQVRKLIQKVCQREFFRYRKITDKPVSDNEKRIEANCSAKLNLEDLAAGNKKYLPVFDQVQKTGSPESTEDASLESEANQSALITHKGALIDVSKLLDQLDRSEKARMSMEQKVKSLEEELSSVNEQSSEKDKNSQKLNSDLQQSQQQIHSLEEELKKSRYENEKYHRALSISRDQLQATITVVDNVLRIRPPWSRAGENCWMKVDSSIHDMMDFRSHVYEPSSCLDNKTMSKSLKETSKLNSDNDSDTKEQSKSNSGSEDCKCSREAKQDKTNDS